MIDSFENAPELIRVEDLHKSFGGLNVLNGITETIHKGEVVSLIGPSGSGKSTFLRCLNRLEEPTSGHIWFDGVDIADKSVNIDKHRQKMGMVFQHFNIFPHMSVIDNITLAPVLLGPGRRFCTRQARRPGYSRRGRRQKPLRRPEAAPCHRARAGDGAGGHAL